MRFHGQQSRQRHGVSVSALIVLLCAGPLLGAGGCDSGERMDQIRLAIAPTVAELFVPFGPLGQRTGLGALGRLLGDFLAALITPLPDTPETAGPSDGLLGSQG